MRHALDQVFLALGQTAYAAQLFEDVMLEVMASANELVGGIGDGIKYQASIDSLSKRTLGQLLHGFQGQTDIRLDIEALLIAGLDARNFIIHHFAQYVGDDLADETKYLVYKRTLYEKCAVIMAANSTALAILSALTHLQSQQSTSRIAKLKKTIEVLSELSPSSTKLMP